MKAFSLALGNTRHIFPIMHVDLLLKMLICLMVPLDLKLRGMYYLCLCYSERESEFKLGSP